MEVQAIDSIALMGKYGLIGVMLALIVLTAGSIWLLYKVVSNHIDHNTEATAKNTEVMAELITLIREKLR